MFEKISIGLGLILIPFYSIAGDTRNPKLMLALGFALILSLWVFFKGKLKPINNKWLYILVGYLFLSIQFAPQFKIPFLGVDTVNLWFWQPFAMVLIFFLMLHALASLELDIKFYLKIISWVGFIMAVYGLLQFFGLDQFYTLDNVPVSTLPPSARMTGTLGQPTLFAPFVAMFIPICLYLKKYWMVLIMVIAVLFANSHIAIFALLGALLFLFGIKNRKQFILSVSFTVVIFSLLSLGYLNIPKVKVFFSDSGRFPLWKKTVSDLISPLAKDNPRKYPFTGLGFGSYKYLHDIKHNDDFRSAHNEYLQFANETGFIGLVLLLCTMFTFIRNALKERASRYKRHLLASFVCIALCAGGTFIWKLGAHIYYTIFICGLLLNETGKENLAK